MPRKMKASEKKAGRRGNNEGSIYQRKDGRWCAQVTIGYRDNGKAIIKYAYGSSRAEVAKKLSQFTNEVFENGYSSFAPSDAIMFFPMLEDWFFTFKEENIVSGTSEKLRNFLYTHIKPEFGNLAFQNVDVFRLQRFFTGLIRKGMCLQSVKHIKQLMNQFYLQYAIKKGLCKESPLEGVVIRGKERDDADRDTLALSPELREAVVEALAAEELMRPIITTLLLTGMRPGELLALKWRDVDWTNSAISIRVAVSRRIEFDEAGSVTSRKQVISNTKTVLSARTFKVAESVILCLREWNQRMREREEKMGIHFTAPDCFVFCTEKGEMRGYSGLRSMLQRFLKKHGLKGHGINLYTFRHTFATMLLEERENPKVVSELMGHAKVTTTLAIYSHVISRTVYETTASTLDRVYGGLKKEKGQTSPCTAHLPSPLKAS